MVDNKINENVYCLVFQFITNVPTTSISFEMAGNFGHLQHLTYRRTRGIFYMSC